MLTRNYVLDLHYLKTGTGNACAWQSIAKLKPNGTSC